jgi:hypothetical protein
MQKVGIWSKVARTVRIQGKGMGEVSRFPGFRVSRFQVLKTLGFEVEFPQPPALFEHFETLETLKP